MLKKIKSILFVICVVMVFTAQTKRPDEKGQQHAPAARPAARPAPAARNNQSRPQVQARRQVPQQRVQRQAPPVEAHTSQPSHQERQGPRVYAVEAPAPAANNNRLFNRQHHNKWEPLYNFYNNQYNFYPYVDVASTVELSADCVAVLFNGQTYYYDRGRFYQQDDQGQYFAVPPPIGIIVNVLPANARQVNVNDQVFYRYKGVFYVQLTQGYQVVAPVQSS